LAGVLVIAADAAAQDPWRIAITGAAIYSTQQTQPPGQLANNPSIPEPPIGGSAAGFVAGAEFRLTSRFGLGAEVSDAARFDGMQTLTHFINAQTAIEYRDLLVSILFRYDQHVSRRTRLGLVAGPSLVIGDALVRTATGTSTAPPLLGPVVFGPYGPASSSTSVTLGLSVGIDALFQVTPHVSVGPTLRAHFISRPDFSSVLGSLRLDSTVLRFGGGIRVEF